MLRRAVARAVAGVLHPWRELRDDFCTAIVATRRLVWPKDREYRILEGIMFISILLSSSVFVILLQAGDPFKWPPTCQPSRIKSYLVEGDRSSDRLADAIVAQKSTLLNPPIPLITVNGDSNISDLISMDFSRSKCISLNLMSYEADRIAYNKALQALLLRGQQALVMEELQKLREMRIELSIDTVHILISDSFSRKDSANVQLLYREHFQSDALIPSRRTLNILMEGYRTLRDDAKVFFYRDCFKQFDLQMDSYTYSTLVRTVRSAAAVKSIMQKAEASKSLSFPLVRCAIESLGKLGDPLAAVIVAGRYLTGRSVSQSGTFGNQLEIGRDCNNVASIFDSSASGDSLLFALLENPDLYIDSPTGQQKGTLDKRSPNSYTSNFKSFNGSDAIVSSYGEDIDRSTNDMEYGFSGSNIYDQVAEYQEVSGLQRRLQGMRCGDAALDLVLSAILLDTDYGATSQTTAVRTSTISATDISDDATLDYIEDGEESGGVLVCTSKGWCRLFTFLQRSIREALEEVNHSKDFKHSSELKTRHDASKLRLKKLRESRDRLWSKLSTEILITESKKEREALVRNGLLRKQTEVEMETKTKTDGLRDIVSDITLVDGVVLTQGAKVDTTPSSAIDSATTKTNVNVRENILFNGRLSDSVLRCYLEDADKAKKMWKNTILPLSKKLALSSESSVYFDEICEKSLEALMFISGYNGRADLGFEIALTVRNRNWGTSIRTKLAKSYVQGKMQSRGQQSQWLKSNILNDGLERSIESELGVQLLDFYYDNGSHSNKAKQTKWPVKTIRIQF